MKRLLLAIALVTALFALTACETDGGEPVTLYSTDALTIERAGRETYIKDLAGNAEYTFTTHRTRTRKTAADIVRTANTTTTTDTIKLSTVHGIIIVDTADGETLYIK